MKKTLYRSFFHVALLSLPYVARATEVTNPLGSNTTICSLVQQILNAAMALGVPVAVLLVVFTGFKYVEAQGNKDKLTKAHDNLKSTLIGLAIFFGSAAIADILLNTLKVFGVGIGLCNI